MSIPQMGFGTFRLQEDVAYRSIKQALACGYRHIDTAQAYENEAVVGQAIVDSKVNRRDLFLTTKVWNDNLNNDKFINSVEQSLNKLRTSYVDLLLIHWPAPPQGCSLEQAITNLQMAKSLGLARNIGVSNFNIAQLKQALSVLDKGELLTNQIEVHPYLQNQKVRHFCQQHNIKVTAYMPFAVGKVLKDNTINDIANKYKRSPAEIVIAWLNQLGMATIPSSTNCQNMLTNLEGLDVVLDGEDMINIAALDCNDRQANPDFSPIWD